jgi:GrpB-like predicted nucleotidyltransferase (UPF0157 family)
MSMSDDQIQQTTVGAAPVLNGRITLAEYDPDWPRRFEREAARIRTALGAVALRIEHIGSTSVPGLIAKPLIDILLVVADPADEQAYVPALEAAGYILRIREPEWYEHRMFKGPADDVNLHTYPLGSPEIDRYLVLRDRLRSNDSDRELYAQAKRDLATKDWKYVQNYADAKTEVIEQIITRATGQAGAAPQATDEATGKKTD